MIGRHRAYRVAMCALLAGLLYLPGLGRPALWEPDEGRYAEIAREMVQSADYITPRDDGVRYLEKPPLMYWAEAAAVKLLGANELAVRLPAALFSIGQVALTCALADVMFGAAVGLAAAAALALSPLFFGFARFLTLDPALSFFVSAALACFYMALRAPTWERGAGRAWLLLGAAMAALGTLVKGPVALVLSGGVALVLMTVERRLRSLIRLPWLGCALIYAALTAPWFVLVARRNPDFLHFFFVHEHLRRYLSETEHGWGPYFLVVVTLGGMWPWIYFVPRAVSQLHRSGRGAPGREGGRLRFLLIWFAVVLVFFSIPRSKLGSYILPGVPPLAILAGYGLCSLGAEGARRWLGGFALLNLALAAALIPSLIVTGARYHATALGLDGAFAAGALALGAVIAFAVGRNGESRKVLVALTLGAVVTSAAMVKAREDAAPLGSYRELARMLTAATAGGCVLTSYRHHEHSLPFYTGVREVLVSFRGELAPGARSPEARPSFIDSDRELAALWASPRCVIVVANRSDLPALEAILAPRPILVGSEGKKVAVSNRSGVAPLASSRAGLAQSQKDACH